MTNTLDEFEISSKRMIIAEITLRDAIAPGKFAEMDGNYAEPFHSFLILCDEQQMKYFHLVNFYKGNNESESTLCTLLWRKHWLYSHNVRSKKIKLIRNDCHLCIGCARRTRLCYGSPNQITAFRLCEEWFSCSACCLGMKNKSSAGWSLDDDRSSHPSGSSTSIKSAK